MGVIHLNYWKKQSVPTPPGVCYVLKWRLINLVSEDGSILLLMLRKIRLCVYKFELSNPRWCATYTCVSPFAFYISNTVNTYSINYSFKSPLITTWIVNIKANSQSSCVVISVSNLRIVALFTELSPAIILFCFRFCSYFVRCTKRADCETADKENHWLWSPSGTCVTIISADPRNMSRRAPAMVWQENAFPTCS